MNKLDNEIIIESKKENLLYSEELSGMLSYSSKKDMYFEAVFNEKKIILEYIKIKFKKNRVKIRCLCDSLFIDSLVENLPNSIKLYCKDKAVKIIDIENKENITLSIKNNDHNYIIDYTINTEFNRIWR